MEKPTYSDHRQRVKRTFLKAGLDSFEPHNALELLLFYAIPRKDTKPLAKRLLSTFGSFNGVLNADYNELVGIEGMGAESATFLKLLVSSYKYYERQKFKQRSVISSSSMAKTYAEALFIGETVELCYCICLDTKLEIINCVKVSQGSLTKTAFQVRNVVEIALQNKSSSVILTHNHPSGGSNASPDDYGMTKAVIEALGVMSIDLDDHIIVGEKSTLSMADIGAITQCKNELSRKR